MGVLLLVYLIIEVAAVWAVASWVGALWTIGLLLAGAIVGSWLARRQGGKAVRALVDAARSGRSGHEEVTDGMLVALGGLLIFLPGFVTDVIGILILVPPTRTLLGRAWLRKLQSRAQMRHGAQRVVVVEGEILDDAKGSAGSEPVEDRPRIIEGPERPS